MVSRHTALISIPQKMVTNVVTQQCDLATSMMCYSPDTTDQGYHPSRISLKTITNSRAPPTYRVPCFHGGIGDPKSPPEHCPATGETSVIAAGRRDRRRRDAAQCST